jgi:hypothetical protein
LISQRLKSTYLSLPYLRREIPVDKNDSLVFNNSHTRELSHEVRRGERGGCTKEERDATVQSCARQGAGPRHGDRSTGFWVWPKNDKRAASDRRRTTTEIPIRWAGWAGSTGMGLRRWANGISCAAQLSRILREPEPRVGIRERQSRNLLVKERK